MQYRFAVNFGTPFTEQFKILLGCALRLISITNLVLLRLMGAKQNLYKISKIYEKRKDYMIKRKFYRNSGEYNFI